jgi:hypothetical protein
VTVKTEFASVEENDGEIRKAIERRAYALYELDGFTDGSDQEHCFRAERELTIQDAVCLIKDDEVTVRLPLGGLFRLYHPRQHVGSQCRDIGC